MTSRSWSLTTLGLPDHRLDILPALMTRPRSASMRCSSLAFQMPRLAAARRRFHFTGKPLPSVGDATMPGHPGVFDVGGVNVLWRAVVAVQA